MYITTNKIIRNINLYLLSDIPLEKPYLSIYNDLENMFKNLNRYKLYEKSLSYLTYYGKDKDNLLIEIDDIGEIFVDRESVHNRLKNANDLNHMDTFEILEWYIVYKLNLDSEIYDRIRKTSYLFTDSKDNLYMI